MVAASLNTEQLQSAFELFNQYSDRLEQSYRDLEQRVEQLTGELRRAKSARVAELLEKERLSQRLALLLEALPGAIIVLDGAGEVCECNSEAERLLNQPLVGVSWAAIVKREVREGGSEDGNIQLRDGRWLSLSRRRFGNEPGDVLLLADITESRQMSALRQREERLTVVGEMTAKFAHDVRTPLASAMLYAGQLDTGSDSQRRTARKVLARLDDLGRMVNDMLGFAAGARKCDEPVRICDVLADVSSALDGQVGDSIRLQVISCPDDYLVAGNRDALRGAVLNLVNNAIQACDGDGTIRVSAASTGRGWIELCVADDGPGIPAELRHRLFEPFFTTRPQGTGLGLAVVNEVALAHGGKVTVDSERGDTRFAIRLPAASTDKGADSDD